MLWNLRPKSPQYVHIHSGLQMVQFILLPGFAVVGTSTDNPTSPRVPVLLQISLLTNNRH